MVDWLQSSQALAPFTISDSDDEDDDISFGNFRADVVGVRLELLVIDRLFQNKTKPKFH